MPTARVSLEVDLRAWQIVGAPPGRARGAALRPVRLVVVAEAGQQGIGTGRTGCRALATEQLARVRGPGDAAPTAACAAQGGLCISGSCTTALGAGYVEDTSAPSTCGCPGGAGNCCVKTLSECAQHGGVCAGAGWDPTHPVAPYACPQQPVAACPQWQCHTADGG